MKNKKELKKEYKVVLYWVSANDDFNNKPNRGVCTIGHFDDEEDAWDCAREKIKQVEEFYDNKKTGIIDYVEMFHGIAFEFKSKNTSTREVVNGEVIEKNPIMGGILISPIYTRKNEILVNDLRTFLE